MLKRLVLISAVLALSFGIAFSGPIGQTVISATTLTNVTTGVNGTVYIGDADKKAFFVTNTLNGTGLQFNVSMQGSYDNTSWATVSFNDYTNGSYYVTPLTLKILTANSTYVFWPDTGTALPYTKVIIQSNATALNWINITCSVFKKTSN